MPWASRQSGGAMGIHYVNGDYLKDDAVDIGRPEGAMYVYEPMPDGSLKLVAVEYITFKGPASLEGQLQLHQRAQSVRPRSVLRTACVGLETEPSRHICRHEPRCFVRRREAIAAATEAGPIAD